MKIDTEADYVLEAYCWSSCGVKNKKEKNVLACIARYRNHDYEEIKEILEIIDLRDRLISSCQQMRFLTSFLSPATAMIL